MQIVTPLTDIMATAMPKLFDFDVVYRS